VYGMDVHVSESSPALLCRQPVDPKLPRHNAYKLDGASMQVRDIEDWTRQRIEKQVQSRLCPVIRGRGGDLLSASFISQKKGAYHYQCTTDTAQTRIPPRTARYTFVPPLVRAQPGDDDRAKRVSPNLDGVPPGCTHLQFDQSRLIISTCPTAERRRAYP